MVNFNFSSLEAFGKIANLGSSGFLSSLNSALGGGTSGSSPFSNLLAAVNVDTPSVNTEVANTPVSQNTSSNSNVSDPFAALQDVASAWKGFIQKWQNYQSNKPASDQNSDKSANSADAKANSNASVSAGNTNSNSGNTAPKVDTAATHQSQTQTATTKRIHKSADDDKSQTSTTTAAAASTTTDAASQSATSDTPQPPSLSDLLAELQAMLQMLQKQIQAAHAGKFGTAAAATTAAAGSSTDPQTPATTPANPTVNADADALLNANNAGTAATDPTASNDTFTHALVPIADMIGELLALSRYAGKKLGVDPAAQTQTTDATTTTQTAAPTDTASVDVQLRANLKMLLDALQTKVSANDNVNAAANAVNISASTTSNAAPAATELATATLSTTSADTAKDPSMFEVMRNAVTVAETFVKQLDTYFAPQASTTANAVFANASEISLPTSGGNNQSSMNSDFLDSPGNTQTNGATNINANTQPLMAGDGTKSSDPSSFANQLSAARATSGGSAGTSSAVEQVMFQLSRNVKNGNDQMTIQLHPADLGSIDIKLSFGSNNTVQGTVVASNPATLDLLLKDVRGIERALQDAGLSADPGSLQFSLGGQPGDTSKQTANNSSGQSSNGNADPTAATDDLLAEDSTTTAQTETWYVTPGRVNLQV